MNELILDAEEKKNIPKPKKNIILVYDFLLVASIICVWKCIYLFFVSGYDENINSLVEAIFYYLISAIGILCFYVFYFMKKEQIWHISLVTTIYLILGFPLVPIIFLMYLLPYYH